MQRATEMAKPLEPGIVKIIQDSYGKGKKPFEIKRILKDKYDLDIAYSTIYNRRPDTKAKKIEYGRRPDIRRRNDILRRNTIDYVMAVFDSEELTAEDIRMRLTEQYKVHFPNPELLEARIEQAVETMSANFGVNAPIIIREGKYKLNKNSPYHTVCGRFSEKVN